MPQRMTTIMTSRRRAYQVKFALVAVILMLIIFQFAGQRQQKSLSNVLSVIQSTKVVASWKEISGEEASNRSNLNTTPAIESAQGSNMTPTIENTFSDGSRTTTLAIPNENNKTASSLSTATTTTTTTTSDIPTKKIEWVRDKAWFDLQWQKECCPFAVQMYKTRYSKIEHRCCTVRANRGEIEPLRALGGLEYSQLLLPHAAADEGEKMKAPSAPKTVLIQGDSLAQQHFLGMICHAWYSNGLRVHLEKFTQIFWQADIYSSSISTPDGNPLDDDKNHNKGSNASRSNNVKNQTMDDRLLLSIQFLRIHEPGVAQITKKTRRLFRYPNYYIVVGWHHGGVGGKGLPALAKFLDLALIQSDNAQQEQQPQEEEDYIIQSSRIIVVNALPSHFPGGSYQKSLKMNNTNDEVDACAKSSFHGDPNINQELSAMIQNRTDGVSLLEISELYYDRGDAHVGRTGGVGGKDRDFLHWCIAPGVLDGLTKMPLAAFVL